MDSQEQTTCAQLPRGEAIAQLNDAMRTQGGLGVIAITRGVRLLPGFKPTELIKLLADYDAFDIDNDPHGERDFGDFDMCGETLFWKIDYYDKQMQYASPDPADPQVTERVLTVMLASEY
jgi:hypothetical protein